jgi:hypothetical protein
MRVEPERLQHWTRVAFAARCARRVLPLFADAWPAATRARTVSLERAIALAEQSAAEGRPCTGLREAAIAATMTAGCALIPHHAPPHPSGEDEASPASADAALVASFAAKVAENAARAANAGPGASAGPTGEAYHFALDAIRAAGNLGLIEVLEADYQAAAGSRVGKPWWRSW